MKKRKTIKQWLASSFTFSWRNLLKTVVILGMAFALCAALQLVSDTDFHVPLIFVLAVLMVSLSTDGYLFGLLASVFSVVGVNYAFTFPYFHFNFHLAGYPLTFVCMFVVSVITCTLMSRVRMGEQARMEADREKTRSNLLRAISHDFRTPLTSIIGTLSLLHDDERIDDERRTLLSDAKNDAEWLINIMENLLSITRFGTDSASILHTEVQACEEVAGEAVSRFRKQYPQFKVEIHVPDDLLMAPMDAMLIEQVLINLFDNVAIHAPTATRIHLRVSHESDRVGIMVEDDGQGIAPGRLEHIFDGNLTGDSEAKTVGRHSMGIGLSVCKSIIKAHGGEMSAENNTLGGATLKFWLPLSEET